MINFKLAKAGFKADCLIVPVFEDRGLDNYLQFLGKENWQFLQNILKDKIDFAGKAKQSLFLFTNNKDLPRVLLLGLGKEKDFQILKFKQTIGTGVLLCQNKKLKEAAILFSTFLFKKIELKRLVIETVVASVVANYSFDMHKTDKESKVESMEAINFVGVFDKRMEQQILSGLAEGSIIAEGVNYTRHLGNIPPTIMNPNYLGKESLKLAKNNKKIKAKVLSKTEIEKLGMGCMLGVAQGSVQEPRFIILEYKGGKSSDKPIVLVGKGVTYDSGGLSLKSRLNLVDMKFDMLGAATVMGVIKVVAELGWKKNIVVLIAAVENMPSGSAFRPDDILTAMNGKTVEVKNTDAEGRLTLADALSYAQKFDPKEVIDIATLTGYTLYALGIERAGFFTKEEKMAYKISKCSETVGEKFWHLPLGEEYSECIKSDVADLKNDGGVGGEHFGGGSSAAAFLEEFTTYPWLHIDFAGAIYNGKGKSWLHPGADGFATETLIEYLKNS